MTIQVGIGGVKRPVSGALLPLFACHGEPVACLHLGIRCGI